jgi:hypothetical protein
MTSPPASRSSSRIVAVSELAVVGRVQGADPGIEDLNGIHARVDLRGQIVSDDGRQRFTESVPGLGMPVHERLRPGEIRGMAAFDRV